jgi:glycerol-3-phosphate dehydrogenase (NAD(P)+)
MCRGHVGVLSGPSFAQEVARGQATALVAASEQPELAELAVQAFHGERLRVYTSSDPVGVEVGGAVKNVMAIATGVADGLRERMAAHPDGTDWAQAPGLNARAALLTRGLAEMTRLGLALGARAETFLGLSGLGDLVLTATGELSRNRKVGVLLSQGLTLEATLTQLGHVAEGVYSARTVLQRGASMGLELPITATVVALLEGRLAPAQALKQLMTRDPRAEL